MNNAKLHKIESIDHIKKFLLGGRATFTVKNVRTENHLTFSITKDLKSKMIDGKEYWTYFISYRSKHWTLVGVFNTHYMTYHLPKKLIEYLADKNNGAIDEIAKAYQVIKALLFDFIFDRDKLPNDVEIYHLGQCSVCGRPLNDPVSIEMGIGPKCRQSL